MMTLDLLLKALALVAVLAGQWVAAAFPDEQLAGHKDIKNVLLRSSGSKRISRKLPVCIPALVLSLFSLLIMLTFLLLSHFLHKKTRL
jgi:hypothetical protein